MTKAQGNRGWAAVMIAAILMILVAAIGAPAQTFKTLHNFDFTDGSAPYSPLVQATDGNLYGTASYGATSDGSVFRIGLDGTLTTLHTFEGPDGDTPYAGLVQATDRNFYGATNIGGANGHGTVFKIGPSGMLTTIYSFCAQSGCADGANPYSRLLQAVDGSLYGTTSLGGANSLCKNNGLKVACGTIFKIAPGGALTTFYSFCPRSGCTDGAFPYAALIQGADGNLYGTTTYGGAYGSGTVFKITSRGALTTLYSFCSQNGCADGEYPYGALVQGADGSLYGTTAQGGANGGGYGTVFAITLQGMLKTLHSFDGTDGSHPNQGLVQATDGNFYGTTIHGGASGACPTGCGTIYRITSSGELTSLHSFESTDGTSPFGELVEDTNGSLYGTTASGGTLDYGTVFSLSVGLGPFVETLPTSGKVGAAIKILGTNLTGSSSVTFNGTAATFKVISPSEIGTAVPAGATTGPVQVVTPSGTLTSNVNFRVLP
jgi:uncharacterized repeat protein (TIGR03803 family)